MQKDGGMEVPEDLPLPAEEVEQDWEDGAGEETPQETVVDCADAEHLLGSKGTPEDGSRKGRVDTGASKVVLLTNFANIGNVRHLVVEDGRADESGNEGSEHLAVEGNPRRDMGIVSEFEILGEVESVRGRDVSVALEVEHGGGVTGEPETTEQLGDNVEGDLYVGDSHDDTARNTKDGGDENTIQRGSGGGVGGVNSDTNGTKSDGDAQDHEVGPLRNLPIRPHQAGVDVLGVGEG